MSLPLLEVLQPMELLERVEQAVRRYKLLRQDDHVLVAVSGGPDSVALLHLLTRMQQTWRLRLHVAHVNHQLRADAETDARFVTDICHSLSVPVTVTAVDVRAQRRGGESTQQAARRLRLAALRQIAGDVGARRIAVGHHADDQAETILLRLLRGTGPTGLGGIRPRRGPFVRPLLEVSRNDIERYCASYQLNVIHDPSNKSDAYARNRIRLHLLPHLASEYNPNITERLARTAQLLQDDDAVLEQLANRILKRARQRSPGIPLPGTAVSVAVLRNQPRALRRRIVRSLLRDVGVDLRLVTYEHTDAAIALLDEDASTVLTLPGNVRVERKHDLLMFQHNYSDALSNGIVDRSAPAGTADCTRRGHRAVVLPGQPPSEQPLNIPGRTQLAPGVVVDTTFVPPEAFAQGRGAVVEAWFDWESLVPPLVARTRVDGDRLRPLGLGGTKKLQDLFVDEKVPRHVRDNVLVIADEQGIVWVAGLRIDERVAVKFQTSRILHMQITSL